MTILLVSVVDATIVLGLALAATALLRRRSAALRHAILATAVVAATLMPAFELLLPQLRVIPFGGTGAVLSSGVTLTSDVIAGTMDDSVAAAGEGIPWTAAFVMLWMAGATVTCAGLATGLVRLARLRSRCMPVAGRWRVLTDELSRACGLKRDVALLQSDDPALLVTCGVRSPAIILPAGASEWTDDRRRSVLLHELAHIRRYDALVQIAGEALRVAQSINPLVWIACRRLRQESEYACDDAVLCGGVEATEYATHLLDVARLLSGRQASAAAPAIAHPSTLERRIAAMLNNQRNRAPFDRRGWCVAALAALAVSLPLAAAGVAPPGQSPVVRTEARDVTLPVNDGSTPARNIAATRPAAAAADSRRQPNAAIAGAVLDQSGGVLPGVQVTLTEAETGQQLTQHTNAAGKFAFRGLAPAAYELVASLSGFATFRHTLTLASGAAVERTITLPIGSVAETITVVCSESRAEVLLSRAARSLAERFFPVLSAQERPADPIRVGGSIRAPKKIRDVKPGCPAAVPSGETTIRITGRIGVDGLVYELTPIAEPGAEPPMELTESALDAVREWRFTPTLLNGDAVEVTISVQVTFRRS